LQGSMVLPANLKQGSIMPKVKLVLITDYHSYDYDDSYTSNIIRAGITDWDEISDDDYAFLMANRGYRLDQALKAPNGSNVAILKQDDTPVLERVESITKLIRKMEEDRVKEEQARIAKKEAAAASRALKKKAKTEAEELALLAALKEKHEKGNVNA